MSMTDITLAEINDQAFLVRGIDWIDDLLAGTLPPQISIEIVQCESFVEMREIWTASGERSPDMSMPWMIHPGIVARIRGEQPDQSVMFAQWSVMLDDAAQELIRGVAARVVADDTTRVVLTEFVDPEGPASIADLSRLRMQLIQEKMVELGVARSRVGRSQRNVSEVPGMQQESRRVDVEIMGGFGPG
jgi:hypothetical protein